MLFVMLLRPEALQCQHVRAETSGLLLREGIIFGREEAAIQRAAAPERRAAAGRPTRDRPQPDGRRARADGERHPPRIRRCGERQIAGLRRLKAFSFYGHRVCTGGKRRCSSVPLISIESAVRSPQTAEV